MAVANGHRRAQPCCRWRLPRVSDHEVGAQTGVRSGQGGIRRASGTGEAARASSASSGGLTRGPGVARASFGLPANDLPCRDSFMQEPAQAACPGSSL
jgi:hypothetical protein